MPFNITNEINKTEDLIQHFVTRPIVPVEDDGQGNYNISPLGFPLVNVSNGLNPTRITPEFVIGYNNLVSESSRLTTDYTENKNNISDLYGLQSYTMQVDNIVHIGSLAVVTTVDKHGYTNGKTITINGSTVPEFNGSFSINVTSDTTFTYTLVGTYSAPLGTITSTYTLVDKDVIYLASQDNESENGYYVVMSTTWRILYVAKNLYNNINVRANTNINILTGILPSIILPITSIITAPATTSGKYYATVISPEEHGYSNGDLLTITNATVTGYNGTYNIEVVNAYSFKFEVSSALSDDLSTTPISTYQILENDLVYLNQQTNPDENGLYIAHLGTSWEFYGFFYEWDGTENDNVVGNYGNLVDDNGEALNHYRKGYSLEETANYLKDKLDVQIEFGKFSGSHKTIGNNGAFVQWLLSGRKVNIGGVGVDKNVFIDGFGLGNPSFQKGQERTDGNVDPTDLTAVSEKRTEINRQNKFAVWGLTNHHSNALKGAFDKSPFVKDYPDIYNSAYDEHDPYDYLTGGHLPSDVDAERWRMVLTGSTSSTDTNVRPLTIDMLWYQRDNSYHNNITLDVTQSTVHGRHSMAIVNNFDKPDEIVLLEQEFTDSAITTTTSPTPSTVTVPDGSHWMAGDFIQFKFPTGTTPPTGISEYTTYIVATGYPSGNDLQFTDTSSNPVVITSAGSGTFKIQRHVTDVYSNNNVTTSLDDINGVTLNSGLSVVHKEVSGTIAKYYIKPRAKSSLIIIPPKGSWTEESLSYDAAGTNGINVYLNSAETDYVTYTHPTMLTADLWEELNQHNDMIPVPFDPATTDLDSLTVLFVDNTLIDYTDSVNKTQKIRSKKTFVHLPTPIGLEDGTPFELDVSLPVIPDTDSFGFNTLGSLSGYKNYVTQPRVYVMSGYQNFECGNIAVTDIVQSNGTATLTTTDDHRIYTSDFSDSNVDVTNDTIHVPNWKDISVGDVVRFKNDGAGALPTATPPIIAGNDYIVTANDCSKIKISYMGTDVDITSASGGGIHSIVVQSPLKIDINGSTSGYYNDQFNATVIDFNLIEFSINIDAQTPAPGTPVIDRVITTSGGYGHKGLTERDNSHLFSPMPEVEFASNDNIYHQSFDTGNIIGNGLSGINRDIRTLIATIYPTTTNTFAWRLDNDPQLRMLPWSIMNVGALGGNMTTGSFANVAYKRNKEIYNDYPDQFKNDNGDGLFSVYDNSISYADNGTPAFTEQQINSKIRIKYPNKIYDSLSEEDTNSVGSFNYQAELAYIDLMRDFQAGRVRVESRNGVGNVPLINYANGYPTNHGSSDIPTSFYDHTAGQEFLKFDITQQSNLNSAYSAVNRWETKAAYLPEYVVNAENSTFQPDYDPFTGNTSAFKSHLAQYFITGKERENNAGNRYVYGDLNPSIDASFEFSVGTEHKFIDFLIANDTGDASYTTNLNDIRRKFWDSYYNIADATQRQMQKSYQLSGTSPSIEDTAKFHGSQWIPFAKMFSPDVYAPSENTVDGIEDYATIIGDTTLNNTLENAIKSNPIATRFKLNGYTDSFTSINVRDTDSDVEEFLRNYVAGYSNRFPFRHYNGFRIAVLGTETSSSNETDTSVVGINTESDVSRIYKYSVNDYLNDYLSTPSNDAGQYLDDNYLIHNGDSPSLINRSDLSDIPTNDLSVGATISLEEWNNLSEWDQSSTSTSTWSPPNYSTGAGAAEIIDHELHAHGFNPLIRYNTPISNNFVVECYINAQDDQSLYFQRWTTDNGYVGFYNAISITYFQVIFDTSGSWWGGQLPTNHIGFVTRKNGSPIVYTPNGPDDPYGNGSSLYNGGPEQQFDQFNVYDLGPYISGDTYRVVFARFSDNTCTAKVYDQYNNIVGEHDIHVDIPVGEDLALNLGVGRFGGYYAKTTFATNLNDNDVSLIFGTGASDIPIVAEDPNPSWWYFEEGNPVGDSVNSNIKDLINVSGMNYLADRDFYLNKMQYSYTRIKMSFVFSEKLGRWLPLDYRQVANTYLTPTFGATALREKETALIRNGTETNNDILTPIEYIDESNEINADVYSSNTISIHNPSNVYNVGDTIAIYDIGNVNTATNTKILNTDVVDGLYLFEVESSALAGYTPTVDEVATAPVLIIGSTKQDYLWKRDTCFDSQSTYKDLQNTAYWQMNPMQLNPNCYPYLSTEFPYNGQDLVNELDYNFDILNGENYRFSRLNEPNAVSPTGINFVVPNNVHGGKIGADNSLFLYQPHMWKVYWHMRPAVTAMEGTDIPSKTARIGGVMADPFLNNMFCYPDARDPQYYVPWHEDMNVDWLNSGWLLIDARIDNTATNPTRDLYHQIDSQIATDPTRDNAWQIEANTTQRP